MPVRVVHTSDIHLGRRFPSLSGEADKMRADDVVRVFNELVDYVIKNDIHLLLIAGSLFDKMHPNRETVSTALSAFGRIHESNPQARIALAPGQEEIIFKKDGVVDCALSIFNHLSYVDVIGTSENPEKVQYEFGGEQVMVASSQAAFFFGDDFSRRRIPLPKDAAAIYLLCAYSRRQGLINIEDDLLRERILDPLRDRGYQYVALGHRNKLDLITAGDFTAIYPGSLERFDFDADRERKNFIRFDIEGGKVQPPVTIRTAARPLEYVNLTCSAGDVEIESALEDMPRRAKKDRILYVALNGQLTLEEFNRFQNSALLVKLRDLFAFVHIENRLMLVDAAGEYRFDALRVGTPLEEFKNFVGREIEEARGRGDEAKLLEELYDMGIREIEEGP